MKTHLWLWLGLSVSLSAEAATYRWMDEYGQVHYGDTVPPQQVRKEHKELDKQGRVLRETGQSSLTADELRRIEDAHRRSELLRQHEQEQQRRDKSLLLSYANEEEIDLLRDRALELEMLQINSLKLRREAMLERVLYANTELSKRASKSASRELQQLREDGQTDLQRIDELLSQRQAQLEALKAKYAADKQRFRELKAAEK